MLSIDLAEYPVLPSPDQTAAIESVLHEELPVSLHLGRGRFELVVEFKFVIVNCRLIWKERFVRIRFIRLNQVRSGHFELTRLLRRGSF